MEDQQGVHLCALVAPRLLSASVQLFSSVLEQLAERLHTNTSATIIATRRSLLFSTVADHAEKYPQKLQSHNYGTPQLEHCDRTPDRGKHTIGSPTLE